VSKPTQALPPAQRALARLTGARLCFGRPVELKGRTVIPVASVRTAGGWGFGNQVDPDGSGSGSGGGGGGALDARPVGFIEISAEGTRFQRIDDGRTALRLIAAGSVAVLVLGRVASRRRRPARKRPPSLKPKRPSSLRRPASLKRVPSLRRLRRGDAQASQDS
jgi:uncharacterized spore protein YtfJ